MPTSLGRMRPTSSIFEGHNVGEHCLERDTQNTYIYRFYPRFGTLRYAFALPVSYRGDSRWELHSWNSVFQLWNRKEWGPPPRGSEIIRWIIGRLREIESRFKTLVATFEEDRMKTYRRIFSTFDLVPIMKIEKIYNGVLMRANIVEFREK